MLCSIKNNISLHHVRWYGRCCLNAAEGAGEFTAIKPVGKLAAGGRSSLCVVVYSGDRMVECEFFDSVLVKMPSLFTNNAKACNFFVHILALSWLWP